MATPVANFALGLVNGGYTAGDTSVTLTTGQGSKFPATTGGYTYPATWWDSFNYPHPSLDPNREIVLVTNRSSDTFTITRGQEGTSASAKNTSDGVYYLSLGITAAMFEALRVPKSFHQGLQLQTHRDSDLSPYQVELVGVESIVMDDGVELRNDADEWTGKVANISVNGAGGLDTGSESVGTLYEIFAIAKEDATRNLLLHKSKQWANDTGYISGEDATQPIRSTASNNKVDQGFKFNGGKVPFVDVKLIRVGSPTGKIWFTIETDNTGKPSGTAVATSHAYDVSRIPTSSLKVRFPMSASNVLSATPVQYHLVAQGDWTVDASNYIGWRMDGSAAGYSNGSKALYNSGTATWTTDTDDDMYFGIGAETLNVAVTMPSGYTKKCFLGWVFNDGSGNLVPFMQAGRTSVLAKIVSADALVITLSGNSEIVDLVGVLPPRALIKGIIALSGTGTGGAIVALGDLRATDISSASSTVGAQAILNTVITTTVPTSFREVVIQGNAMMAHGTFGASLFLTGYSWD